MAIAANTTAVELAALVSQTLEAAGIKATLSGGGAVSVYTHNKYQSNDLDFVTAARRDALSEALRPLGFTLAKDLRHFTQPGTALFLEFPAGPLEFGDRVVHHDAVASCLTRLSGPNRGLAFARFASYEDFERPPRPGGRAGVSMARGECTCGAVQFEIDADLTDVFVCHCSICRRSTGSNGIAVVVVPNDRLRWLKGQEHIATWKKPNCDWQTWFCRICGSPVPGENDTARMYAPAGSIVEGGDALRVAHHVWVGSRAVWDEIGDAGKQHPEGFRG